MDTHKGLRYSEADFQAAYRAITVDKMTLRKASIKFNVPRTTLNDRIQKGRIERVRKGPATVLTDAEELRLEQWIVCCWMTGFTGCREATISNTARGLLEQSGRTPRYPNFKRRWYATYLKRHSRVREAMTNVAPTTQATWNFDAAQLRQWFERVESFLTASGLAQALFQPERIFHCSHGQFGNVSVMFSYSADGRATPPLLVFQPQVEELPPLPKGWAHFRQKDGAVDAEVLQYYLEHVLQPYLTHAGVEFPIVLFVDQQSEPPSFEFYETMQQLDVVLVNLYHWAFRNLRHNWKKPLHAWHANTASPPPAPQKEAYVGFVEALKDALIYNLTKSNIKQAFNAAGIYPFVMSSVDTSYFVQSKASPTHKLESAESAHTLENSRSNSSPSLDSLVISKSYSLAMDFDEFKSIIGAEQLLQLEELDLVTTASEVQSQELLALHRIYNRFRTSENVAKCENPADEDENDDYDYLMDDGYEEEHTLEEP